jgi:hypothetical protein
MQGPPTRSKCKLSPPTPTHTHAPQYQAPKPQAVLESSDKEPITKKPVATKRGGGKTSEAFVPRTSSRTRKAITSYKGVSPDPWMVSRSVGITSGSPNREPMMTLKARSSSVRSGIPLARTSSSLMESIAKLLLLSVDG